MDNNKEVEDILTSGKTTDQIAEELKRLIAKRRCLCELDIIYAQFEFISGLIEQDIETVEEIKSHIQED